MTNQEEDEKIATEGYRQLMEEGMADGIDQYIALMLRHTQFLAQISIPAAKQFYKEFKEVLDALKSNPFQFPVEEDQNLPQGQYRKALFAKRYQAIFMVDGETVYLDAMIDCRMDGRGASIQSYLKKFQRLYFN